MESNQQQKATPSIGLATPPSAAGISRDVVFDIRDLSVFYGKAPAVKNVSLAIHRNAITALIGPSGCGKSTVLRSLNRMNDLVPSARIDGTILYQGVDLYGSDVDPIEVRRRIGMVFQRPNPFPKSIYDNVAYGLRILGLKDDLDGRVERALQNAALWGEVKGRLKKSALGLSGGQQQRLCIARAIAVEPDVVLLDEPASALDPISTSAIEEGVQSLLARQTPVAADLRFVLAVLRVNLHLERMADYCVTVAKLTKLMGNLSVSGEAISRSIEDMGQRAEQMIRVAMDAFATRDAEKAQTLVELDELIDRANRGAIEDVLSLGDSADEREYGLRMLVISRCVERIGDHAVDIGEQVAYLVTGEFREFTDASHPA